MTTPFLSRRRPVVDSRGLPTNEFAEFMRALWDRTGGLNDAVTPNAELAQSGPVAVPVAAPVSVGPVLAVVQSADADAVAGPDVDIINLEPV